jgi:lysyl-tRNA synthetase class 2
MPSTVIRSFRYDRKRHELDIVFQTRRRYVYEDVPRHVYAAMKAASSKGRFFNHHIRDRFSFRRQPDT